MFQENKDPAPNQYTQMELNAKYGDGENHSPENVNTQVEAARAQAAFYETQRLQWEEQRAELEEANAQKAVYLANLNDIGMRIHNAHRRLAQEMASMDREYHELEQVHQCFEGHLNVLSALHPKNWSNEGLTERLRDSLPKLDRAENDLNEAFFMGKKMRHSDVFLCKPGEEEEDGLSWAMLSSEFLRGLFFHLPLIVLLFLGWLTSLLF